MKKFITLSICLTVFLSMSVGVFAHQDQDLYNRDVQEEFVPEDHEAEPNSVSAVVTFVKLTLWQSHRNAHTSYTRTVIRQGVKHIVKYEAMPKEGCWFCENL